MQNVFREFVFIVFDRKRLIVRVSLMVFIITVAIAVMMPSIYRSSAKFSLIVPQSLDPLQQENSYDYRNRVRRFLQDQKELILSNRVLIKVVQGLFPEFSQNDTIMQMDEFRKYLEVNPPGGESFEGSSVFILAYTDKNPVRSAQVATLITDSYLEEYRQMFKTKSDYSYSFFLEQTKELSRDMLEKENKVREFETEQAVALIEILNLEPGKANQEVGPTALLSQFNRNYRDLETELSALNTSTALIEKEISKSGIPAVMPDMEATGRSITIFKTKVAQLQIQLNEMKTQFGEDFVPLKQVEQELKLGVDSLKKELQRTVTAQKISAQMIEARIRQSEKIINQLKEQIQTSARERATYDNLKQEYNIAKTAYTVAMGQLEQARMAQALNQEKQFLTLIDRPVIPSKPFKPNRILLIIGGLISGSLLGIAVALTVSHFDHRIKTIYDIETHLNVPILGSISNI